MHRRFPAAFATLLIVLAFLATRLQAQSPLGQQPAPQSIGVPPIASQAAPMQPALLQPLQSVQPTLLQPKQGQSGQIQPGQNPPASSITFTTRTLDIDNVLARGSSLESERRWGEALVQYEDALRLYPDELTLEKRFQLARLHYDLGRRYADRSFSDRMLHLPSARAIDLYGQVLAKIESHYVDQPSWKGLLERGTLDFETALGERTFIERNAPGTNALAIERFTNELNQTLAGRNVADRGAVRNCVVEISELAQSRLGIPATAVILEYLSGATNSLDPYSAYLTPDQLADVYSQIDGNFVGLGIELKAQAANLTIVRVIPGSPAEQAGIHNGDQIVAVDNRSTRDSGPEQAANLLQGPEGSVVKVVLLGPDRATRDVVVRRRRIEVPSVDKVQIIDQPHGVAYLKLTCFQKTTSRDLEAALWRLHRDGMRSLVIDLRGNPGGLLISSVEVADLFLDEGTIVSTHGRAPQEDGIYSAHPEGTWHMPLTLIIDQDSASAAEIFSGAIHDHQRGTVVGVRSFGKGSVQGIFQLDGSEAGLRLTTAKFYSPKGRAYSRVGVMPDLVVRQTAKPINGVIASNEDAMLNAALDVARNAASK